MNWARSSSVVSRPRDQDGLVHVAHEEREHRAKSNEQRDLIKVPRMGDLLDADEVAARIQPRAAAKA
jgi:hypothetical protein